MINLSTAVKSGAGTSMFSRTGARTITANKIFQQNFSNVDELVKASKNVKKFKPISLSGGDEPPSSSQRKLPVI